uniref:Uncharacterized protein n=1 Tax=Meloidogyne floridensis TaxID=298350 RepID=A0A915P6H6_9BILA
MSKKKRDREKKKILESKNLGKESVDESLDIEMKDVEEEDLIEGISSHSNEMKL